MKIYTSAHTVGNKILVREIVDGVPKNRRVDYNPTYYLPSKIETEWKSIKGDPLEPMEFSSIKDSREFLKNYSDVDDFEIHGDIQYEYQWIVDEYPEKLMDRVGFILKDLIVDNIDIECSSENGFPDPVSAIEEVQAITIKRGNFYHVFGFGDFTPTSDDVTYYKSDNEREMLLELLDFWKRNTHPHVITGWNTRLFDIPYLYNRISRLFGEKKALELSPWKKIRTRNVSIMGRDYSVQEIYGIGSLDFLDLYKKYTFKPRENYRLNTIAHAELGERKLDYSEYSGLHNLYKSDFQKFIEYNIQDVALVSKLDEKLQLISLAVTLAYSAKVNFDDVYSQVRMWDVICYDTLKKKKIAIPPRVKSQKDARYAGAYVKDPVPGMYKWIASFDLNSLYPHLIMQYNISPETFVEYPLDYLAAIEKPTIDSLLKKKVQTPTLQQQNVSMAANGEFFSNAYRGFLPEVMHDMYLDRKKYKKKMLKFEQELENVKEKIEKEGASPDLLAEKKRLEREVATNNNFQTVKKVCLNSAYGAIGNQYFRYYDTRLAEAVTISGQLSARWIEEAINKYLNKLFNTDDDYIIASDTDSVYVNFERLVNKVNPKDPIKFLDKACEEKIQPLIDKSYQELATMMNAFEQKMEMKREALCDMGIWTGKKHYILNVHNSEGVQYPEPKVKAKGMEMVKSSTPEIVRDALKSCVKIILTSGSNDDIIAKIEEVRKEFNAASIYDIAFPRSVNNLKGHKIHDRGLFSKGAPMHVKGALLYNFLLEQHELTKQHETIKEGEKIKYLHLIEPNPVRSSVIAFIDHIPEEFDVHDYVDYNMQFEKAFLSPLRGILDVIGWDVEKKDTLDGLFA